MKLIQLGKAKASLLVGALCALTGMLAGSSAPAKAE
jgi:hypothetical protein